VGFRNPPQTMSWTSLALFAPKAVVYYLRQSVFPVFMQPMNSLRPMPGSNPWWRWISPIVLVAAVVVAVRLWKREPIRYFAFICFLLFLSLPILNARAFPPDERVHDRYLYVPVLGVILLFAVAVGATWSSNQRRFLGVAALLSVVFAIGSAAY